MKIWANTIVQNEERYIWFSIMSVIDYVDKVLVWDTGSTDNTVEIIQQIIKAYPDKIMFKEVGVVSVEDYPKVRQEMLEQTTSDWMIILDGDEVWWRDSINDLVETIKTKGDRLDSLVNRYTNLIGDIYHYQDEAAGNYKIDNIKGHITIRAMNRRIPGFKVSRPHGKQGFFDERDSLIQDLPKDRRLHLEGRYLHFTHLPRSSNMDQELKVPKRAMKIKHEIGNNFALDFYYPEVFFISRPSIIPNPWRKMDDHTYVKSFLLTLPRKLKRLTWEGKSGY